MNHAIRLTLSLSAAALLLWVQVAAAHPHACYALTRIDADPPGTLPVFATGLNNRGFVAGLSDASDPETRHAFAWRSGVYVDLHPLIDPAALFSEALDINDRLDVVGDYVDAEGTFRNFLLRRGRLIPVEIVPGRNNLGAEDINNRGQIAGITFEFGQAQAFIWDRGEVTLLPTLEPASSTVDVRQINDRGVVVGTSNLQPFRLRAVIWQEGEIVNLGVAPGFFDSRGVALNDRGQVIGRVEGPGTRGFLWQDGVMTLLPLLEGSTGSAPLSINEAGDIVGQSEGASSRATLWHKDLIPVDLNTAICAHDPLRPLVTLQVARKINDRGRIVASGADTQYPGRNGMFLLTPTHRR
jgi:probable HAF family extracellular repeat protein